MSTGAEPGIDWAGFGPAGAAAAAASGAAVATVETKTEEKEEDDCTCPDLDGDDCAKVMRVIAKVLLDIEKREGPSWRTGR